jgi:hypothetical protein
MQARRADEAAGRPIRPLSPAPTDVAPARFEATVYEVQVPDDRIAQLNAQALEAKAATPRDIEKALAEFGKTRVLYKVDQPVNLYRESIRIGSHEPMVIGSGVSERGGTFNTVQYRETGVIFTISASPAAKDAKRGLDVRLSAELAALSAGTVEITSGAKAAVIHTASFSQSGPVRYGRPAVAISLSAPSAGDEGSPVAYVVCYMFGEIKP